MKKLGLVVFVLAVVLILSVFLTLVYSDYASCGSGHCMCSCSDTTCKCDAGGGACSCYCESGGQASCWPEV